MTIGTGTYNPLAKFAFPRSYIREIITAWPAGSSVSWAGNVCSMSGGYGPTFSAQFVIAPQVLPWSSNRYTLDFVPVEFWYKNFPADSEHPANFYAGWGLAFYDAPYSLFFNMFSTGTVYNRYVLPPPPSGYWLPAFPT